MTDATSRVFVALQLLLFAAFALLPRWWSGGWAPGPVDTALGWLLIAAGLALGIASGVALGRNLTPFPEPRSGAVLVTRGPYRRARHPIYGGLLLAALGWTLVSGAFAVALLTLVALLFFDRKRRYEERRLRARFSEYERYRALTHVFVPFVL